MAYARADLMLGFPGGPIFVRGRLDDALASSVIAQLLLPSTDTVNVYIDCAGGSIAAALTLYDLLGTLGARLSTTCTGTAGGAAVLLLAVGPPGRRVALPHARIHLTDDAVDLAPARFDDAEEARRITARWRSALLQHVTQAPEQLAKDMHAGRWLSAAEATEYGIIDRVL